MAKKKAAKDPAAVALGRKGGLKKVPKGLATMSEDQRQAIVMKGVEARRKKAAAKKKAAKKN